MNTVERLENRQEKTSNIIMRDARKERIKNYWGKRSDSFLEQRRAELHSPLAARWIGEIREYLPEKKELKILDVGCGAGFFSILLAKEGHKVVGTDLTKEMIEQSKILAREEKVDCHFIVMDAEKLEFQAESFDIVISRNLTWTLPNAKKAYREWFRVLKKGGILLNFDGNYGENDVSDTSILPENHAHHMLGDEMMRECENIKKQLSISLVSRPAWDMSVLSQIGFKKISIDFDVSDRVYIEKDEFYNPVPLFCVCATK